MRELLLFIDALQDLTFCTCLHFLTRKRGGGCDEMGFKIPQDFSWRPALECIGASKAITLFKVVVLHGIEGVAERAGILWFDDDARARVADGAGHFAVWYHRS